MDKVLKHNSGSNLIKFMANFKYPKNRTTVSKMTEILKSNIIAISFNTYFTYGIY